MAIFALGEKTSKFLTYLFMKTIFFSCFLILFSVSSISAQTLSVSTQVLPLQSGPGTKYKTLCQYGKGFPLKTLQTQGSWVQVKDFENDSGWVPKKGLSKTPHTIVKAHKGTKKTINIRSGPGENNTIKGKAYYGVVFMILGKKNGWTQVKHESGLSGWIKNNLLW